MDWLFLGLVILGSVWGWAKKSNRVLGQHTIQEVTKERIGRLMIAGGWSGLIWYASSMLKQAELLSDTLLVLTFYSMIYFAAMGIYFYDSDTVIKNYKNQRRFSNGYDCISYKVARNMYSMHPELFKWDYNSIYPAFKGFEFSMTYLDLLRFSLLYNGIKVKKNGTVSQLMLEQLEKDMARVQKEKDKSIQEVNHASTELAGIMASMKGEKK